MGWLQGITAEDIDVEFTNGQHFVAVQEMTEEIRQEVTYQGAFGYDQPILRRRRKSDENTFTISVVLLREGIQNYMNSEDALRDMLDFQIQTKRGIGQDKVHTYTGCNWTRISIRSTLDTVTLDADISVPGYNPPFGPKVGVGG